jgi:TusA-related sulfurtransferase
LPNPCIQGEGRDLQRERWRGLVIIADDPAAEEDLRRWAKRAGHEVIGSQKEGDELTIRIRRLR